MSRHKGEGWRLLILFGMMAATTITACSSDRASPGPLVATLIGGPRGEGSLAAAWTQEAATLKELWSSFQLPGEPPSVGRQVIVLAATGESGSCPSKLVDARSDKGTVRLAIETEGKPPCDADFRPITFVLRFPRSIIRDSALAVDFGAGGAVVRVKQEGEIATASRERK